MRSLFHPPAWQKRRVELMTSQERQDHGQAAYEAYRVFTSRGEASSPPVPWLLPWEKLSAALQKAWLEAAIDAMTETYESVE